MELEDLLGDREAALIAIEVAQDNLNEAEMDLAFVDDEINKIREEINAQGGV